MIKNPNTGYTKGLTFGQKVGYYALCGITYSLSLLPMCVLYGLSSLIYLVLYKMVGYRVKLTRKNLSSSFPDKTNAELKAIERGFYHFLCDYMVETIKLISISEAEIKRRMVFKGMEHITHLTEQGRSVIVYMGHLGNWEWVTGLGLNVPGEVVMGQIYHILENPAFNAFMLKIRGHLGHESISMNVTLRTLLSYRKKGIPVVVGFLSDQVPLFQATYHSLTFMNHPGTIVITGTERITKQLDYACAFLDVRRVKRGYYEAEIVPMGENTKDVPDWQLTDQYFQLLEQSIMRQPEIYLWSHNRWKRTKEGWEEWKKTQSV